jgi:hypothetical protein
MTKGDWSVATDATSGTTNYALVPKANDNSFVVDATEQNCITK